MRHLILAAALLTSTAVLAAPAPHAKMLCADLHITVAPAHAPNAAKRAEMRADFARFMAYARTCTPAHPTGVHR